MKKRLGAPSHAPSRCVSSPRERRDLTASSRRHSSRSRPNFSSNFSGRVPPILDPSPLTVTTSAGIARSFHKIRPRWWCQTLLEAIATQAEIPAGMVKANGIGNLRNTRIGAVADSESEPGQPRQDQGDQGPGNVLPCVLMGARRPGASTHASFPFGVTYSPRSGQGSCRCPGRCSASVRLIHSRRPSRSSLSRSRASERADNR
jgi:hypothetical protein